MTNKEKVEQIKNKIIVYNTLQGSDFEEFCEDDWLIKEIENIIKENENVNTNAD